MLTQDVTVLATSGDSSVYPFDEYVFEFEATGLTTDANNAVQPLPILMGTQNSLTLYEIDVQFLASSAQEGKTSPYTLIRVKRSRASKGFSIFIILMMWFLSVGILTLALSIWIRGRKVEPPTLGACFMILFALTNVRNSQPGIPSIGVFADMLGYYWNVALTCIAAFLLTVNYIVKYKAEKKIVSDGVTEKND